MGNYKCNHDKIELRSEKVQKIINEIPSSILIIGFIIIISIIIALIFVVCLCPYPYSNGEKIIQHIFRVYSA